MQISTSHPQASRKSFTFEFDARSVPVDQVELKGSFDPETGLYSRDWKSVPMRDDGQGPDRVAGDGIFTASVALQEGQTEQFGWGAHDGNGRWLVTSEDPPTFKLDNQARQSYAPVSNHLYGLQRQGEDITFRTWSPQAAQMTLELYDGETKIESHPMQRLPESEDWFLELPGRWEELEGKSYRYALRDHEGSLVEEYGDPYARFTRGQQRGLERIFVDPVLRFETGWYDDSFKGGPNYADNPQWARFTVSKHLDAEKVELVLSDNGQPLDRQQLLERLGEPSFKNYEEASPAEKRDVDVLRSWLLDKSPTIESYLWTNEVSEDGSIRMTRVEGGATKGGWTSVVNNFPQLEGLSYEFHVYKNGKLVGDQNGDGRLDRAERLGTPFNEPDNVISPRPGSARGAKIWQSRFEPRYFDTPRKQTDYRKFVIYEAHVGSFLSRDDNAVAATFEDLVENLDYLEELGVNTIELLPTQEFGGKRDWGYTPDYYFAGSDAYGFEMDRAQAVEEGLIGGEEVVDQDSVWINGTDALKFFVDQAHQRGFQVLGDVVYNHTSGKADGDDPLASIDGDHGSFFRWNHGEFSYTPWGKKPNYSSQAVKDYFTNHAVAQLTEFGFDGLRFDFTQVLHNTGPASEQIEGMNTLRQIQRALELARPGSYTVAEDFSLNWLVAADLDKSEWQNGILKKGMDFEGVWNDRFRDDVYDASEGGNMDRLMDAILHHHGVSGWDRGVLYAHSHDEVGNSGQWVGRAAAGSKEDEAVLAEFPRGVARTVAGLTLLGPGVAMLWQGEEFLANNDFKHGLTSTWGQDTGWLDFRVNPEELERLEQGESVSAEVDALYQSFSPEEKEMARRHAVRNGHFQAYQDLIELRQSSPAFLATAPVERVMTHNADQVLAFSRSGQDDQFVVIANFSEQDRHNYAIGFPPGQFKEVFNSNAARYGGDNLGNGGRTVSGQDPLVLPAGTTLVFERV